MAGSHRAPLAPALALAGLLAAVPGVAAPPPIRVLFNQELIDSLYTDFDVADPRAVFELVFSQLPETVRVYPTENYYYFSFAAAGRTIAGNLRLDVKDRDRGVLHMGWFRFDESGRTQDRAGYSKEWTLEDGVAVEKRGTFDYTVTHGGRTVRFLLNDLDMRPPRPGSRREGEVYVGPVFDESGLRFYLMYDRTEHHFFYVLDEERRPAEELQRVDEAVSVGRRTGFAFYEDRERRRKILVAVNRRNTSRNNYYDGPFDQLPDNFVDRTGIQGYIEEAYPEAKGQVDRYGGYLNQPGARLVIMPYTQYEQDRDLAFVSACVKSRERDPERTTFLRCITPDLQQASACQGGGCTGPQIFGEATLKLAIPEAVPEAKPPAKVP